MLDFGFIEKICITSLMKNGFPQGEMTGYFATKQYFIST